MAPYEHVGWDSIYTLSPEIMNVCFNAIGLNIMHMEERGPRSRTGIEVVKKYLSVEILCTVDCHVGDGKMELRIASDERVVEAEAREKWMWNSSMC